MLQVFDSARGLSATGALTVTLAQSNRPPSWAAVPTIYAPQLVAGIIGTPLSGYVTDLDLGLGIGEQWGGGRERTSSWAWASVRDGEWEGNGPRPRPGHR